MFKKTIKFTDYDGNVREEDFYFNLTQAELVEMEMSEQGGLKKTIQNIVATQDQPRIVKIFKDLILRSYGEKSPDGKAFIKIDRNGYRLADMFAQTEAYSILFMELATDAQKATEFLNGIVPPENAEALREAQKNEMKVIDGGV